uniref:Uncharacterized protein n=1 Tax=Anguilla anguilla TaxID=7936 RepID=A0A0E9RL20_ANGAN
MPIHCAIVFHLRISDADLPTRTQKQKSHSALIYCF